MELRTVPALHQLVVAYDGLMGGSNGLDLYRWGTDCKAPALAGRYDFGTRRPHEFYLWQDPQRTRWVLLFVAFFAEAGNSLDVIDISDLTKPTLVSGWSIPSGYENPPLHSISLSPDGRTAYLSLWTGGLVVADASDFASGSSQPILHLLTPSDARFRTPPGNVHSAIPVPGQPLVVTTDERYPPTYGIGCPYGTAHLVDVSNPARPTAVAILANPENDPTTCPADASGTWSSHNPTATAHLALISWHSGGLQVFGLDDVTHPARLAEIRPAGSSPTLRDLRLGASAAMTWSYPVISAGIIYVADINQGLLALRYQGPTRTRSPAPGSPRATATWSPPQLKPRRHHPSRQARPEIRP